LKRAIKGGKNSKKKEKQEQQKAVRSKDRNI